MERIVHNLVQGTPEWDAFRLEHNGASEAAAMLGLSKKVTRIELLRAKKTGIAREFSAWFQEHVLDHGHEVEEMARPHIVAIVKDELYPATYSFGKLSASCDGITMDDSIAEEHKQWNEDLAALVAAGVVPDEHMPQCQQVLLVTGAERLIFVVSDGTPERMVHAWVEPDQAWFDRITRGWAQFDADLANYVPEAPKQAAVAAPMESLPAVSVQMQGQLVVASNLPEFAVALRAFIGRMVAKPSTDQEFADAEAECKALKAAEDKLEAAEEHSLASLADVAAARKAMADLRNLARTTRLAREKLVVAEKDSRRLKIVTDAQTALADHLRALNARLGRAYMPQVPADFAGAIKGKKNFDSMEAAVNATLANAKIEASSIADRIQVNLATLQEKASQRMGLFADSATLVLKAPDDFLAIVSSRIQAQHIEEQRRAEAAAEQAREKIRREEQEAAERRVREQQAQQDREREEAAARARAALVADAAPAAAPVEPPAAAAPTVVPLRRVAIGGPAPASIPMTAPTLTLGNIAKRLGFAVTADFLKSLGFEPAARERGSVLFHEYQFAHVCAALVRHIEAVQAQQAA